MNHNRFIILLCSFCLVLCTSCIHDFGDVKNVDFMDLSNVEDDHFHILKTRAVDLADGLPDDTQIPEQDDVTTRTTSIDQSLLSFRFLNAKNRKKVLEIVGTYQSTDENGKPVTLSGKVLLPANGKFSRYIIVSHYTIASNLEAPSNIFPLEGVIAPMGYALILPDYLGYGVTADRIHPYLIQEVTSRNVIDMYVAVEKFLTKAGYKPEHDDILLMGYSQGGATTMCVQHMLETESAYRDIRTHRLFAGGGPYDVKATFEQYIHDDNASYPCAILLMVQSMAKCNGRDIEIGKLLKSKYVEHLDDWVNSKKYTTHQLNKLIGTHRTSDILTEAAFNEQGPEVAAYYSALSVNSISGYNWTPSCPCLLMHSINDDIVGFDNAMMAKNRWQGSNITFNYGVYGGHTATYLKFLSEVKQQIEWEKD